MDIWELFLLVMGGCVSGLLAGLLGFGGGMLFMLVFTNYLTIIKIPDEIMPQLILANSMFTMFIGGLSGSLKHHSNKNFYFKPVITTGLTASFSAIFVTHFIIHSTWYNKNVFTIIFILIVGYIAFKIFFVKESYGDGLLKEKSSVRKFFLIGCAGGSLSALAGVGGGIAMVPMLTKMLHIDIKKATGISLGVITVISLSASVYAFIVTPKIPISIPYSYGLIILPMVLPVSVGCLLFSPIGVSLSKKLTSRHIRLLYVVFLVIAVTNMLYSMLLR